MISCGMVVPASGISTRRRRAASTALRPPPLTPVALPAAVPTRPLPAATATPRPPPPPPRHPRRPRRHCHHRPERRLGAPRVPARPPRAPSPPVRPCRSSLELQSAFAGAVGHRLYAPVILIAAAVEHDLGDPLLLGLGREQASQSEALGRLALALDLEALGGVCGPDQCDAAPVVHDLRVDVLRGAEHDQPRPLRPARHFPPHPELPPLTPARLRPHLMNRLHGLFL